MSSHNAIKAHELAARFQASPSLRELIACLSDFRHSFDLATQSSSNTLEVYASILTSSLVPLFITEPNVVDEFVLVFSNVAGIGALLSRLAMAPQHEVDALVRVLERVLEQPGIVGQLVHIQPKSAISLIFGSRILNVTASKLTDSWAGDARQYTLWLAQQLVSTPSLATDAALFDKAAKVGAPTVLVQKYLQPENFRTFQTLWSTLRTTQQYFILSRGLINVLPSSPAQAGRILLDLKVAPQLLFDLCLRLPANLAIIRAAVVLARETVTLKFLVSNLIDEWSSKIGIECSSLAAKQTLTQLILASCCSLSAADAKQLSHSPKLLEGISLHLSSTSANVRKLGTLVAETFAKQSGQKLEFGITYDEHEWWLGFDAIDSTVQPIETNHLKSILHPESHKTTDRQKVTNLDSDDEDDDDDNNNKNKSKNKSKHQSDFNDNADEDDYVDSDEEVVPPFYIKDLVAYLQSDKYGEVYSALTMGASLIMRKAQFGSEVPQYASDLLRVTCSLTDKFSITRFAELRQDILNAVIVADPKQAPVVITMFKAGDWSLAQRQSLLNALVFGAHELAQGNNTAEFERLPPVLHSLFVTKEDQSRFAIANMEKLSLGQRDTKEYKNENQSQANGTVLRRSQRLDQALSREKNGAVSGSTPRQRNMFSPVSHLFFFPLIAAAPPLRASSYDALIYAQWLRTLGIIVVEAYPTQHMPDMVEELWPVLVGLAVRGTHEIIIEEALYTCLLMIVTMGGGIIIQSHAADIGVLIDKIYIRVQASSEPRTQQLAAAAGAKLAEMAAQIERQMFGSTETV